MCLQGVPGMRRLSSVSVDDTDRSVAWVVGSRDEDGSVGLQLVKISEEAEDARPVEIIETRVAADVLGGLPDWAAPESFFASYYTKNALYD